MQGTLVRVMKRVLRVWQQYGIRGVLHRLGERLRRLIGDGGDFRCAAVNEWIDAQRPESYQVAISEFLLKPTISILCPVCDPPLDFLQGLVASVQSQLYDNWQLCIADDGSKKEEVRAFLQDLKAQDERISIVFRERRGHIAKASQSALELATGEYVALVDHDDLLPSHALCAVVESINKNSDADILYSDEAKISHSGDLFEPAVKPDWSPMYFRSFMYTGHLTVYAKSLIDVAGGFCTAFDGSQDYALFLTASKQAKHIVHIPRILYFWRSHRDSVAGDIHAKEYAFQNAQKALEENLHHEKLRFSVENEPGAYPGLTRYRAQGALPSIIRFDRKDSLEEQLHQVRAAASPYLYLTLETLPIPSEEEFQLLIAPLAFPDVAVTVPLFIDELCRGVLSAGYSHLSTGYAPNMQGESLFTNTGPDHRLAVAHEVEAIAPFALCASKEQCIAILQNHTLLHGSSVVVPEVRVPCSAAIFEGISEGELLTSSPKKRYYPIGLSTQKASFRFSS